MFSEDALLLQTTVKLTNEKTLAEDKIVHATRNALTLFNV